MAGYDEHLAKVYTEKRDKYGHTDPDLLGELERLGITDKALLDFGCGDGRFTFAFASKGVRKVVGIDASEEMIRIAQGALEHSKTNNVEFKVADGRHLPFDNESFDIVFANYVLVHFDGLEEPLREIRRVLKPGGHIVATINTSNSLSPELTRQPTPIRLGGSSGVIVHDYLRSDDATQESLRNNGFEIKVYREIENAYAEIEPSYAKEKGIESFHCVLFSASKR